MPLAEITAATLLGMALGAGLRHALAADTERELREDLTEETQRADAAETMLRLDRLGLTYQSGLDELKNKMHLHATHLDVVEARIDKQGEAMKEQYRDFALLVTNKLKPLATNKPRRKK